VREKSDINMKKPFVYVLLEKQNLLYFIAIMIFISSLTYMLHEPRIATDHFLVGIIIAIWGFAVSSYKNM